MTLTTSMHWTHARNGTIVGEEVPDACQRRHDALIRHPDALTDLLLRV